MLPQLRQYLLENWIQLPLDCPRPRNLEFLVQATGVSKLCCYIFADAGSEPRWVAKMMRSPCDNEILTREYNLIQDLRRLGSCYVSGTIPHPLFTTAIAGHLVGIEPYLAGQPMDGLLSAKGLTHREIRNYLDLTINWLLRTQNETSNQYGQLTNKEICAHFKTPIMQLQKLARLTDVEKLYLERLMNRIARLSHYPLPLRFNHGDFQPGNILLDGNSINVIDWEFGKLTGLPLMDVFSFLARTYARCHGLEEIDGDLDDYLAAFEAVFFDGGSFAELTTDYVRRVCLALDIDPAWTSVLFSLFLVIEANKYHAFLSQRADRGYVYLLRSRQDESGKSHVDQLARQKNVWLLGHLAQHEERLIFSHVG